DGKLAPDAMQPGVRCVRCHTAATKHLAGLAEGELHLNEMKKLSAMPPEDVATDQSHYDSKCLACHAGGKANAKTCPVAAKNCASCHMPQVEVPGSHHLFADHWIRVANRGK